MGGGQRTSGVQGVCAMGAPSARTHPACAHAGLFWAPPRVPTPPACLPHLFVQLQRLFGHKARLRHRPLHAVHQQHHAVAHVEHALHLTAKVRVTRRVDHVDLHTLETAGRQARGRVGWWVHCVREGHSAAGAWATCAARLGTPSGGLRADPARGCRSRPPPCPPLPGCPRPVRT